MTMHPDTLTTSPPISPVVYAETTRLAIQLADAYAHAAVRQLATPIAVTGSANTWYDTTPMVNTNGRSLDAVDKAHAALAYGQYRAILAKHPEKPNLVRIVLPS